MSDTLSSFKKFLETMEKFWKKYNKGWVGTLLNIISGFVVAVIVYNVMSFALGTQTPLVSVFSGSMEHDYFDPQSGYYSGLIFGVELDKYWSTHGKWYEKNNISKEEFESWPFSNGFKKGDMLLVVAPKNLNRGDVIVFDSGRFDYPIIHRIVGITNEGYETKGDRNPDKDPWIIKEEQIYGKAVFVIPLVGWVKVLFSEITGIT